MKPGLQKRLLDLTFTKYLKLFEPILFGTEKAFQRKLMEQATIRQYQLVDI